MVVLALSVLVSPPVVPTGTSPFGIYASIPPWNNWTCNPNNPSPAALDIPAANPTNPEATGSLLTVSYEFRVVNYQHADYGITLYLPSVGWSVTIGAAVATVAYSTAVVRR